MAERPQSDHIYDSSGKLNSTGSANAYVIEVAEHIAGYHQGMPPIRFKANFGNSGSATADIVTQTAPAGLGAVTLKKNGGATNLASGDIVSGGVYTLIHDGTNFQVLELNAPALVGIGLTDGDKGDITVSSNGTVWTIDAGVVSMSLGLREIADITSGDTLVASDRAKIVKILSGTGTLAFTAAATLGAGWFCYIDNSDSAGDVTLNPDGAELIDGLASWILYSRGVILVQCDGSAFRSVLVAPMHKTYTADDTFTKPGCGAIIKGQAWGAGASGGRGGSADGGAAGGGGACVAFELALSALAATETVTIGTGGPAQTSDNQPGTAGTDTTFGSLVTAYGGGAGDGISGTPGGGGGGGTTSAGESVSNSADGGDGGGVSGGAGGTGGNQSGSNSTFGGGGGGSGMNAATGLRGGDSVWGGGGGSGGAGAATSPGRGGNSVYGGAGGGGGSDSGTPGVGGTSLFAGNGGAGATGAANATAGSAPGGGGGGSETGNSGAGARGELRLVIS